MAMSVVQAAVMPARLAAAPRAQTGALRARPVARPARRCRVAARASADGAAEVAAEVKDALDGSSLFLVGMMGTGKSSVGKKLAASLGYSFFDTCVPQPRRARASHPSSPPRRYPNNASTPSVP